MAEHLVRATLDDLGLEVQHLRELGKEDIATYSPFAVEREEDALRDLPES